MEEDFDVREAEDINETVATVFNIVGEGEMAALFFGEEKYELDDDGNNELEEIVYDTKVRMTVDTLERLRDYLDETLEAAEGSEEERGVH